MLNAYPAAFGCHKSKIFKLINVKDHGIQKTRTTPAGNGKQLQILTFLDGRESVCKRVCAIGDCLGTPGRLEDLPGGFFSVRRRHRELYEAPKRSASEESAITCHGHLICAYPGPGQQAVASCAFSKTHARSQFIVHERDVDTLSTGRCLSGRPTIKTTRPDNNYSSDLRYKK